MLTEVKKHLTPKQIWADAEFFFLLNLGLVATAAGIALFQTPNHFAFGGTSGLSIVLATLFPQFNVGAFMWVVNAVLVVFGVHLPWHTFHGMDDLLIVCTFFLCVRF